VADSVVAGEFWFGWQESARTEGARGDPLPQLSWSMWLGCLVACWSAPPVVRLV
jgi:hypothetical protein